MGIGWYHAGTMVVPGRWEATPMQRERAYGFGFLIGLGVGFALEAPDKATQTHLKPC